jgi:hypothetical protein
MSCRSGHLRGELYFGTSRCPPVGPHDLALVEAGELGGIHLVADLQEHVGVGFVELGAALLDFVDLSEEGSFVELGGLGELLHLGLGLAQIVVAGGEGWARLLEDGVHAGLLFGAQLQGTGEGFVVPPATGRAELEATMGTRSRACGDCPLKRDGTARSAHGARHRSAATGRSWSAARWRAWRGAPAALMSQSREGAHDNHGSHEQEQRDFAVAASDQFDTCRAGLLWLGCAVRFRP